MKPDPYWFFKKWGTYTQEVPIDNLMKKINDLEERVIKLEDENISMTNELYRLENSLDSRIDILAENCRTDKNV